MKFFLHRLSSKIPKHKLYNNNYPGKIYLRHTHPALPKRKKFQNTCTIFVSGRNIPSVTVTAKKRLKPYPRHRFSDSANRQIWQPPLSYSHRQIFLQRHFPLLHCLQNCALFSFPDSRQSHTDTVFNPQTADRHHQAS